MNDLDKLIAIEDIKQVKARYFRCMDTKDWRGLESVLAPDLVADFREATGASDKTMLILGSTDYVAMLSNTLENVATVHHGHMAEIQISSASTASGVWAMEGKLWPQEGSILPFNYMHGYGHYLECYVKRGSLWMIKQIQLKRLRVDTN